MINSEEKIYTITQHFNSLNGQGKIKSIIGSDGGYAKITEVVRGCSLFIHHINGIKLVIDLFVSPTAKSRHRASCKKAVATFMAHFQSQVQTCNWKNSNVDDKTYDLYIVNVTNVEIPNIIQMIEDVRHKLEKPDETVEVAEIANRNHVRLSYPCHHLRSESCICQPPHQSQFDGDGEFP